MRRIAKNLFMKQPEKAAQKPLDIISGTLPQDSVLINSKGDKINPSKPLSDPLYQRKVLDLSNSLIDSAAK